MKRIIRTRITCNKIHLLKSIELGMVFEKGQRRDKSEFVTKSVGIIVTIIFL